MAMASSVLCLPTPARPNPNLTSSPSCTTAAAAARLLHHQTPPHSRPMNSHPSIPRDVRAMASYKIKLLLPDGAERTFTAPDDDYLLVTAEDLEEEPPLNLPASCRAGACSACCAKLLEGEVDQSDGSFLSEAQIQAGYVLTCVAYPLTDLVLKTHVDSELK